MDNRLGEFENISNKKFEEQMKQPTPMVFKVGEIIEVRGSRLRVEKILRNKLVFKLLPALEDGKNKTK
jgi:uncharacterized Zn finger protein